VRDQNTVLSSDLFRDDRTLDHAAMTTVTRLHISPFTPSLLDSLLGPSIRSLATDISFHSIPTFPENNYGYISLPSMEADKLKKKLNGSILKGKKLKVEPARPGPKQECHMEDLSQDSSPAPSKTSKKRKAEDRVLEGYELPSDRQVKRGWTEPASAKKDKKERNSEKKDDKASKKPKTQPKSKYTESAECLFRTKIPPNKTPSDAAGKTKEKKAKKKKASDEVEVHEFSQTVTYPSFIKSAVGSKTVTSEFDEEKGWIDEEGNVRDAPSAKTRKADYKPGKKEGAKERAPVKRSKLVKVTKIQATSPPSLDSATDSEVDEDSDWTSSSGSAESDISDTDSDSDSQENDSVSEASSSAGNEETEAEDLRSKTIGVVPDTHDGSVPIPTSSDADVTGPENSKDVHPLEALFKRPVDEQHKPPLEVDTGFSFFGGNDEETSDDDETPAPAMGTLTPFSKRDRQFREIRSAAPTPDTAVPNRITFLPDASDEEMEDADDNTDLSHRPDATPSKSRDLSGAKQQEPSDFVQWFWEHRGENNRAWKRRRREAGKEKRQRENRRKGMKGRG
jgi:hypothetical protein